MARRFTYYGGTSILTPPEIFGANYYDDWDYGNAAQLTLTGSLIDSCLSLASARTMASTSTLRPTLTASQINGYSVARFDGTSDGISVATSTALYNFLHNTSGGAWFAIMKANNHTINAYLVNNTIATANVGILDYLSELSPADNSLVSTVSRGVSGIVNTTSNNVSANFVYSNSVFNIITSIHDSGNATAANRHAWQVNSDAQIKNNVRTGAASSANATYNLTFGKASNGSTNYFSGDLARLIIVNSVPTPTQLTQLLAYFYSYYGTFPI